MPRPSDWNVLGLHGDPTPGDPVQIRLLVDDLVKIGNQARSIAKAIDQVMNTADSSVFAGKTADALRGKVDDRLRNHINDVADSFWEVSQNLSAWANDIEEAQRQADGALSAARGLAKDDPQVEVHRQTAQSAGTHLADVGNTIANSIRNASDIRLPISDCQVFWEMFQILAIILIVPALIFGGPVALLALGVNMTLFVKAAIDFARGDIGFLDLFLAGLGIIAPTTKALPIFAIGGLLKSGFKAVLQWGRNGFLSLKDLVNGFRFATVFTGLRDVARISLSWVRQGGLWVMQNFHNVPALAGSVFVKGGLVVVQGVRAIPVVVRGWGSAVRAGAPGAWQNFRIFAQETWSSQMADGKWTRLILPVTHTDVAEYGLKGALRMGFWDRGVMGRGVWDLPVGGTVAHTASAVPMGPHGATPHLDLGHADINMARMDLENVRFGNFADTHTSVRPSSFSVAPVSTVDLTGLRVGTVNPVAVHGANAVFDNSTAGFRAVRHMDDVVDIAGTQMSRMRIDAMDAAPGQMSGGLGVSAAAPGGHVTHSSGLYVPGSAGTPVVHEGVDVAALVAKGNGGNLLAQGPTGVLTAPPGGTGALHTALTGVPAPAPGATGLHDLLAAPGAPGAGTGAAHSALTGVPAPPSGAGVHDLLAAPGGTGGAHGPLTGVPGHQSGTGAAGGSVFDLLSGGAKGTPNNPVPSHIGADLGDNVAGAARANQAHMALDEIVRPAGSGRPGSVVTDTVPGSTAHGVPAPGLPKGGVHGTPPKDAARSALDLLDDGRGVRPVDGPAFAGAPGTGKAVDADTGHAFAGAPARSTDDVVATPGTHGKAAVTGDGHVAVPLRQDPAPAPATGSGGGRVHSHQAELFHEVNLKLGKMGSGAVTVEAVTAARQVLEDLRGAAFTKVDIRAQADQLAVHLAGPERGHLPGGVRDTDLTHDAPTSPGPGGHHAPPVPPRPPRPESGLLDGLDDVDLDGTGAPMRSHLDMDDDSVPGSPVGEHGTEDLDGFSEFVDLIRPLRQHVEQAIDNPAANIEVALVASPGGRTWREFSDDVGHAMVAVMLPGERKPLTIGFYPEEGHLFGNPGAIVNDAEYLVSGHVRVLGTYRITAAQLFDGYRYAMANSGAVYDLFRYNCVRFAEGFVSAALGKSVADLWVAAPYRLVDTMLRRDGAWHWADGTSPVAKLTADDTIRYQDAFGEVEDWRRVDPDGVQGATDQAKTFVLFDHQRPLIDGNVKTVPQRERLEILEQFEKMITHTILNSGDDAGRQLSRQLGETYGTLRPGLSDLPGPSVTVPAADGSLSGIGRGSVDSVPESVPSPGGSAAGDSAGHLPPSSVQYPSDVQHMFGEIDDMLQDMGLFRTSFDDLPSGPPSPVHPGTGGGDVHVGTGGDDVVRFMDDTRPVRQHLEHAIADPAADIRLVLGTDGSTGARSLTVLLPGRDAPVPLGPGAPGELGAVRGTADGAPAGGTHVLEEHRITAAQLENAYLYAARNLPLWHTDAGRFTDGFMNAVLDARPAVPDGSAGRAVRDVTADVTDAPLVVGDKGKGKPPGGTLDTTGTGSDHGGVRGNFADDLSEIDASAAITDARRELINARTIRDDLQTRYVDGVGTSAEVDGVRYLESWQQVRQADAALARAEAHWNDLTGGAPLPEVQSYTGHGLGGGAPRLPDGLRSLLHLKGRGDAVPPAPEGIVQSVDHVPSATHVVTPLEGGKLSHALVPSGQDLTVAHWLSEPQSAHGWPKGQGKEAYEGDLKAHQDILTKGLARAEHDDALKSVLLQQQKSFDENTRLFQALEGRTELRNLRMPQLSAIVMAERRAIRTLAADTDQLTTKLRSDEWEWAKGYRLDGAEAGELITKVHKHLQDELSLTVNLKLGNQLPGGGTLLDAMTADQQLLRNAWEIDNAGAGYYVTRGNTEEALGLPASVKRTTDASGIYPGQGGKAFAPTAADIADLPNYAALTSKYRPSGVKMYGQAVFHLKPNLMERATFTPADSFGQGLEGALSVTGRGNMLPLLNHGPEVLVRLAFAEATDFQYDSAFRGLRDAGKLEGKLNRYFEAQLHGGVKWDDLDRVVLVNDGFNPAGLQAQKLQLEQFAKDKGLSFTVEVHNARPGAAASASGVHPAPPAPPGSGGTHPAGTGGPGPSPAHAPGPVSGHPGGPDTSPAPGGSRPGAAADELHVSYEDLRFTASLLDESGVPRADLFTDTALRVERSGDASFVSPAAPSASGGSAKLTDDQILNVVVGTGGRNGDERRTLGGFEFGAGTRSNDGKNLVSRPIVVTVKDGGTEAEVAVHLNVMLSSGNEADVTVAGKKLANTTEVTITGSKYHLTARPHTDQNLIDLHGPSSDTASKSIHVGPSNAKSGWNSRPGNTRNLAQALGVSELKLIEALDNRFPPSGLVDTIHRFQDDVERAVVHGSGAEDVRVHFQGDKSFPVRGDSRGVSAPAVSGLSGGMGDFAHGAGAGRVDLTLDAGWDAARGAAAPKSVKHSWVDPVSTPRGGGAHAPRYEVRAGYDVRRFELGDRSVTDLTVKVRLADDGLSATEVDALWDRALGGVERVFNRPGEVLRDGSVLHVTLERVTGNAADAHLNVKVGGSDSAMNQHQWRIDATEQDLSHELGHQLGLRDEYRDTTAGHRPEVDGSLMGNYHNAAPEGLSQGGLRSRYLDLIHAQVVSHDHVHVPRVAVDAVDGIAPHAPKKAKPNPSQPAAVPATFTQHKTATRFTDGFSDISSRYQLKPVAQYDGMAKGSLKGGEGTRFVATVIATPDTDLLTLAQTYGTAFGKESLGERLGLVIGVNGRVGRDADIVDTVRKFAQQWEKEGDFSVSVSGFTWEQWNPQLLKDGGQKMVPYGALREAVVRDDLTRGMLDKLKPNAKGEVYLHVGDADVKSMVVGGKPLFDRAAAKIEALAVQNGSAPEMVTGGYTLPEGVAKNAADLDLAVRDAMAKTDTRAIYFPEPNTFIRVDQESSSGLEKDIRFGEISGGNISYEAREGERLLESSLKNRGYLWQGRENQGFVFDSELALVTDGGRIAKEVGDDPRSILSGLTQSHANSKTWTEQIERYIKLHHPDVLAKDPNVGRNLAAIAFHGIQADGTTTLVAMTRKELGRALPAEAGALMKVAEDFPAAVKQLLAMATDTRDALVTGINKNLPQSVSPSAPSASTSTAVHAGAGTGGGRLTPDAVRILDSITGSSTVDGSRRTLGGFEFGRVREAGSTNLISRPVLMTVTEGDKSVQVAVHLNVMVTPSGRLDGTTVTLNASDFHLTARSKAAQDRIGTSGPSALTADNSIHVGPSNAKTGWDNRGGNLKNLADELGITKDSLVRALDSRFPPGELLDTVALFQRDVERAIVHASTSEVITVEFRGDKSFPVQGKSPGVSARAVDAPTGVVDDFFLGAGSGAGRADLTLDAGWDAARGAAVPNSVKHSWVDPVSTPRGGGAHAPRYEVQAGYDVRRFEVGGRSVTDLTVRVRLAGEGLSPSQVDALWDRAVSGVERVFNRPGAVLRDESVLHVTLERVTGNASDAHLNVNVGGSRGAMNQHQWRIDATEQDLAHELGHQLGLRDEYRDTTAGHRPEVDGSLMGNYHNAAPEDLSQGGLRPRYLDLIHAQVVSHDHVPVPHADVDAVDGIAPQAPKKAKPNPARPAAVPPTFTRQTDAVRFTDGYGDIASHYRLKPVAQYDGAAKGGLQGGDGTRFVATVIATPDTDLLTLAKTYGTAFTDESVLGERLGLVIGVNGRAGKEAEITDTVRTFAQQWEQEGNFEVSVTGFTWRQPDPKLVEAGAQKEIPYGALREAVVRDDLTRGMLDKVKLNAGGEVYLHVGDADVKSMVVGGEPLFERAAARIESLSAQNDGFAPEMVSGGYTLPGGAAKNAADLDLAVRDAMAKTDARTVYFPEPNTFVRVDPANSLGLEKDIRFGEVSGRAVSYEAREGERLLDSLVKNRRHLWQGRENQAVVFDSGLALVTDGERIALEVGDDSRSLLTGLTQSHANPKTWTEQMEHYLKLHHPHVLTKDQHVGKSLAAIAFHDIRLDGTELRVMKGSELTTDLKGAFTAVRSATGGVNDTFKQLVQMSMDTRNALVNGINKHLPLSVSAAAPAGASSTRLAGDEVLDTTAGHRPEVDGSLTGNYHNAAPEGLSQGGLRPRYLDLIHSQVASHDHVHVPHLTAASDDVIAPGGGTAERDLLDPAVFKTQTSGSGSAIDAVERRMAELNDVHGTDLAGRIRALDELTAAADDFLTAHRGAPGAAGVERVLVQARAESGAYRLLQEHGAFGTGHGGVAALDDLATRVRAVLAGDDLTQATRLRLQDALTDTERQAGALRLLAGNDVPATPAPAPAAAGRGTDDVPWAEDYRRVEELLGREGDPRREGWDDLTRARQDLGSAEDALPHGEASTSRGLSTIEEQLRSDTLAARDRVTSAIDGLRDQGIDPHQVENRIRGFNERAAVDRGATPGAGRLSELPGNPEGGVTRVELSDSGIEGNNGLVIERVEAGDGSVSHRVLGRGLEPDEGRTVAFRDGGFDVRHTASDTVVRYNESGVRTAQDVPLRNAAEVPNGLRLHTDLNGRGRPLAVRLTGPDAEHHLAEPLEDGAVRVTDTRTGATIRYRSSGRPIDEGMRLRGADGAPAEEDLVLVREGGTTRVTDIHGGEVPRTVTPLGDGAGFRITDDVTGASVRHDGAGRLRESGVSLTRADGGRGDLFLARDGAGTHTLTNALGVPQRGDVTALPGGAGFRIIDDGTGATSRYTPDGRWQDAGTALADPADGTRGARVAVADGSGGLRLTDGLGNPLTERVTDVGGGRLRTIEGTTGRSVLHDAQARPVETGTALADPATGRGARFVVPDAAGGHRLTDAAGARLPERVQALPGGGFRVSHADGYRTFAPDGAFTGDGVRLTGRGGAPAGHLDRPAAAGPQWLDDTFAPDPQRAVTVHPDGHIEIARPGHGHQVFHGTTGQLVQEVTPLPGGGRQITAADGSFARDGGGAPTVHGTPLPNELDGRVLVAQAPSQDAPNGVQWLEDAAGNRLRHWDVTVRAQGDVRIECTLPGSPRRGEFTELDRSGTIVRQGFNVLDAGRSTGFRYEVDRVGDTWQRTDAAGVHSGDGVFHHGTVDAAGAANGRLRLLSSTGAPVPVFERRLLPGGGVLDAFRRTDTIAFGRTNPRSSWAHWDNAGSLRGSGSRNHDTAGTGWHDVDGRGRMLREYRDGLQKYDGRTGHTVAVKEADGSWTWHRFDGAAEELDSGPRTRDRHDSGWTDRNRDGEVVQRQWGMGHLPERAGQYQEWTLTRDRSLPGTWERQSPHGKEAGRAEVVDGHLLVTERWREQRPPVWVRRGLLPGAEHADGAYAHVLGDNAYQMFTWEKRPIGTTTGEGTSGVRYVGMDGGVLDLTADGGFARLTTKLHDGTTLKVGDHAGRPGHEPASAAHQPWEAGQSRGYRVPQDPAATGLLWTDEFRDVTGAHRVAREGLPGGVVREYTTPRAVDAPAGHGTWVTRDAHGNLTGMRQPNPNGTANSFIEGVGKTDSSKWTWREVDAEGTAGGVSGTRKFFRGSSDPKLSWDDSFRDRDATGRLVRERRMLDKGRYVEAWRDPADDNRWLTAAYDRTGNRIDPGPGLQVRSWWNGTSWQDQWSRGARHFRDELRPLPGTEGATVRLREVPVGLGGPLRVREYDPAAATPHSVWKEFDHESVVRERKAERGADGTVTGYLETDAWRGQWNRYDAAGGLVAQRTDSGLVWERGPLGQMRLVGNEYDYRGALTEIRGWGRRIREAQRMPWSGTVVPDGAGAALREARYEPYWRTVAYKAAVEFGQEFVLEFGANLIVNGIVAAAQNKPFTGQDALKAFANAAVSSGVKTGLGIAAHENRIPWFRNSGNLKATLANIDGGKHPQRRPFNHDKTWTNEWAGNETPTRWRGGIYDFTFSAGTSVISGWVNGAMNAAVWGVSNADGTTVKLSGADAFLDGGINAAAALTTSASTALVKNVVVLGGGSRLFHRQGFADFWIQLPFKIFEKSIQSVYLTGAYRASINPSWYQVPPAGTQ
ncbi:hypothetical protein OIE69_37960 [Actinacidiphila glaucinigra]|uniref:hypothetical protein n=1 Tax=Actinacidiphila glaucinigra TaxID=235986 RepID=UPI002DDB5459|nr:hypothetical protein [Actinacidiphila glaucinigra]WSD64268.1 hypothetical protein OIE69_37960 [Actinacidiphila glaucinigra]